MRKDYNYRHEPERQKAIARYIVLQHNELRAGGLCRGYLLFTPRGLGFLRWAEDDYGHAADKIIIEVRDHELAEEDVHAAMTRTWDSIEAEADHAEQRTAERVFAADVARMERDRLSGHRRGAFNCPSCGSFMSNPTTPCAKCGNVLGTHNATEREQFETRRAEGYGE